MVSRGIEIFNGTIADEDTVTHSVRAWLGTTQHANDCESQRIELNGRRVFLTA